MNSLKSLSGPFTLALALASAASAEIKNFSFKGVIQTKDDRAFLLDDSITVGTPFEGFYTFETTTADTNTDSTVGDYRHKNGQFGVVVKIGNYVFRTNPQHVDFLVEIVNRPTGDNYLLRSYNNVCSQPIGVSHIAWQLDDSSGTAVSNAGLPSSPPLLSSWQSPFGFDVRGDSNRPFLVRGQITSIVENPAAIPQVPSVTIGEATEVRWESKMGYFYQMQKSSNLVDWADVGVPVLGDGDVLAHYFTKEPGVTVYYRAAIKNFP